MHNLLLSLQKDLDWHHCHQSGCTDWHFSCNCSWSSIGHLVCIRRSSGVSPSLWPKARQDIQRGLHTSRFFFTTSHFDSFVALLFSWRPSIKHEGPAISCWHNGCICQVSSTAAYMLSCQQVSHFPLLWHHCLSPVRHRPSAVFVWAPPSACS